MVRLLGSKQEASMTRLEPLPRRNLDLTEVLDKSLVIVELISFIICGPSDLDNRQD